VNASVSASDLCNASPPSVVLTSITSNEPDDGLDAGDTANDVQDASLDTLDLSFLLRRRALRHRNRAASTR